MKIVKWDRTLIHKMSAPEERLQKYNFEFHGIRLIDGISIGIFITRLKRDWGKQKSEPHP